jgi:3-hydroxymyristoyl/3-hydroxydecanoyl-(acyl carrier protein) dehydratase
MTELQPQYPKYNPAGAAPLLAALDEAAARTDALHQSLLAYQAQAIASASQLAGLPASLPAQTDRRPALLDRWQLEEFAKGSVARCFGPEFAILDTRQTPRIPNGRLLLMDRVTELQAVRGVIAPPAAITTEFDVWPDAWFFADNPGGAPPLAVLMEMALQPCGILSAAMGTALVIPAENNLFRNLDGEITFGSLPDLRGKTVVNRAALVKSVASGGLYIQEYRFELAADGCAILSGSSTFGYFTRAVMARQAGLDLAEKSAAPEAGAVAGAAPLANVHPESSLLRLADELRYTPQAGRYGQGLVTGERAIAEDAWFFENHFYQDPVMPGSLGVETITGGLWSLAAMLAGGAGRPVLAGFTPGQTMRWKYRGQVLPANTRTRFEAHIKQAAAAGRPMRIAADADFWVDGTRIYAIENIPLQFEVN